MANTFYFYIDSQNHLLEVFICGSVFSYIAVIFNTFIFLILFRKNFLSPATIVMQGLALADCLTAFCSYGLEPLLQTNFECVPVLFSPHNYAACKLQYPYCAIYTHMAILSMTFHTVSILLTTCLGIQKVVAIAFPIWTNYHMTHKKSVICCISCFLVSVLISCPRHFSIQFKESLLFMVFHTSPVCKADKRSVSLAEYSSMYYLLIQTVLTTCCCIVMVTCTVYIIYKLVNNKFSGRQTERRRQERRSIKMVVIVMFVFLLSEVPRVFLFILFSVKYISQPITGSGKRFIFQSVNLLMMGFEQSMKIILRDYTGILTENKDREMIFRFVLEGMKMFTIIGCISNFIIYISMSRKLRNEIKSLYKRQPQRSRRVNK